MKYFGWIIACFCTIAVSAQDRLVVAGSGTNLYVSKIISGTQSLIGLSEQYNIPFTTLVRYNNLSTNLDLRKGDELRIPLTRDNFYQYNIAGRFQPVYHIFKQGDNLSRICQRYNRLSIDTLKRWNNLADDNVAEGMLLTVGFIINNKALNSSAAYQAIAYDTIPNPNVYDAAKFGAKVLKGELKPVAVPVPQPPVPLPQPPVVLPEGTVNSANRNAQNNIARNPNAPSNTQYITRKPGLIAPTLVQTEGDFSYRPRSNDEGYFAHIYQQRIKDRAYQFVIGDAAIFKTISGWSDRKFYVLVNEVLPGTIVRITAPNKKSICAKVLGPLPETKGGAGLVLRMNDAAAAALGMDEQRFSVSITYVEY